jgi:hypothetical protein
MINITKEELIEIINRLNAEILLLKEEIKFLKNDFASR